MVDATLADTFDAHDSDGEDEDNDGDDRQRLMRGEPTPADEGTSTQNYTTTSDGIRRPPVVERRVTHLPVFAPTPAVSGRVYGGGTQNEGVFSNLSAKPDIGEKLEEHPPVSLTLRVSCFAWTFADRLKDL